MPAQAGIYGAGPCDLSRVFVLVYGPLFSQGSSGGLFCASTNARKAQSLPVGGFHLELCASYPGSR
jgi:hypothetical protein